MAKQNSDNASWLRPIPEEFTRKGMTSKRRMILSAVTVVVLLGFCLLIWMSYTSDTTELGPVPVIHADGAVVKIKPDEPGGKEIRFQDKEVFNRVDNMPAEEVDVIASSSEIPLKRPVKPEEEQVAEEAPAKAPQTVEKAADEADKIAPAAAAVPAPVPVKKAAPTGNYMIQIGAFAEKSKAEAFWATVKKNNSSVLANLSPVYMRVDLGAKGVLYRVRGGMIDDRKSADNICTKLKQNNQNCLVVTN
ncbi:MAG: SPOR domain-containing protein [Alphaproteobacteria bacterium]|nr:SPOR domain-containing protein [Alphaproteobacteria bacterium]HPF46311.1 SPOR domain-containing protein [Emcibacteraceae bacterium]